MAWTKEVRAAMGNSELTKMEEGRSRRFSIKQRLFLTKYLELGNATEAVMQVYHPRSRNAAHVMADNILKTIDWQQLLEMAGVSDAELGRKLNEGLNANKIDKFGKTVPDLDLRHKYLTTAMETKKKIKNKLEISGENGQPIKFNILAGNGYVPPVSRSNEDITASTAGTLGRSAEVQNLRLASPGTENNDSNH